VQSPQNHRAGVDPDSVNLLGVLRISSIFVNCLGGSVLPRARLLGAFSHSVFQGVN